MPLDLNRPVWPGGTTIGSGASMLTTALPGRTGGNTGPSGCADGSPDGADDAGPVGRLVGAEPAARGCPPIRCPANTATVTTSATATAAATPATHRRPPDRPLGTTGGGAGAIGTGDCRVFGVVGAVDAVAAASSMAPQATLASGSGSACTGRPSSSPSSVASRGIRLVPPTRCTPRTADPSTLDSGAAPDSVSTRRASATTRRRSGSTSSSNAALVRVTGSATPGTVSLADSCRLSTSLAARASWRSSSTARIVLGSREDGSRSVASGCAARIPSMIRWSRSSPPRSGSPAQDSTA